MATDFHPSIYLSDPQHLFSEQMRRLRVNLGPLQKQGKRRFLITSSWEGEGKTTVVINLAAALAETGWRVMIVDGDLRQQTITRLLLESYDPASLQVSPWLPKVSLLAAPPVPPELAANTLSSNDYQERLRRLLLDFDFVLVDSPPLSACSDALTLGQFCDGALVVTSEAKFRGIPEGHNSEDLRDANIEVLGVVITNAKVEP